MPRYDERKLRFGMAIGLNFPRFKITHSDKFIGQDTVLSILSPRRYGFVMGVNTNYRIGDFWEIRSQILVSISERAVVYTFKNRGTVAQNFETVLAELPILFRYHSERRKNLRFYLIGGIKPVLEVASFKKVKNKAQLRTKPADLLLEYGIGAEVFYEYFKWAPEIKFSHGLVNLLVNDVNAFSDPLTKLTTHNVTLLFNLE